jgi:hypothetical protein
MRTIYKLHLALLLTTVFSIAGLSQDAHKTGDTIYVNAFYGGCVRATVLQTDPPYWVHVEEGTYKGSDTMYSANRLGECKQAAAAAGGNGGGGAGGGAGAGDGGGDLKAGTRVDVYLSGGTEGKNRGTIIDTRPSQYKVRYDGCSDKYDTWENSLLVHPAATISTTDAEITFLTGKWGMTSVGVNADQFGTTAAWGRAPGIQINGDGSYIWFQGEGKAPVRGQWNTHAKIEGARFGTEVENGIIIKDANGAQWKMYRRRSTSDNKDHITIRMMCQGLTQIGTRVR